MLVFKFLWATFCPYTEASVNIVGWCGFADISENIGIRFHHDDGKLAFLAPHRQSVAIERHDLCRHQSLLPSLLRMQNMWEDGWQIIGEMQLLWDCWNRSYCLDKVLSEELWLRRSLSHAMQHRGTCGGERMRRTIQTQQFLLFNMWTWVASIGTKPSSKQPKNKLCIESCHCCENAGICGVIHYGKCDVVLECNLGSLSKRSSILHWLMARKEPFKPNSSSNKPIRTSKACMQICERLSWSHRCIAYVGEVQACSHRQQLQLMLKQEVRPLAKYIGAHMQD